MIFAFGFGTTELFVVFLVILLLFGAKNIPKLARSLGRASKEFKNAREDFEKELLDDEKPPSIEPSSESVSRNKVEKKTEEEKQS